MKETMKGIRRKGSEFVQGNEGGEANDGDWNLS